MKNFDEFIERGIVKIRKKNVERVKSLIEEASKRLNFYNSIPISEKSANYIVENMYDVVRELVEARMLLDGYKSYSHEATVSYLKKLGFSSSEVKFMDELRSIRNQTKYYGHLVNEEYAKKVAEFANKTYPKLKELIRTAS